MKKVIGKINYSGDFAVFNIRSGKFYNSYDTKTELIKAMKILNKNGVRYECLDFSNTKFHF